MKFLLLPVFLFLSINFTNGQDSSFSKNSIKFIAGMGFADDGPNFLSGAGTTYSVGYQRNIWKERLRYSPQISFGIYTSKGTNDVPEEYFNSINLHNNLYFDLLKYKAFSIVIAGGFFLNTNRGLKGTGGDPGRRYSEYFIEYNFGGFGGTGFRINPKIKRLAFDFMLLNINIASSGFTESGIKISLDYKLK